MNLRAIHLPFLIGLLAGGISPQLRGAMPQPQGRRQTPEPGRPSLPGTDASRIPGGVVPPSRMGGQEPGAGPRASLPGQAGRPPMDPVIHRRLPSAEIVRIPTFPRRTELPTPLFWRTREHDLLAIIRREARRGYIPVTPFPGGQSSVTGNTLVASGWRAYGFLVPPGGQVLLKLSHPKRGWFQVYWMDKWAGYQPGMMVKPGEPEALYTNKGKTTQAVYAIVDDPGQWATPENPYTLEAKRSFDPAKVDAEGASVQDGIWNLAPDAYWMSAAHP